MSHGDPGSHFVPVHRDPLLEGLKTGLGELTHKSRGQSNGVDGSSNQETGYDIGSSSQDSYSNGFLPSTNVRGDAPSDKIAERQDTDASY